MQNTGRNEQSGSSQGYHGAAASSSGGERSPLRSLSFFNKLGSDKQQTKDGQAPKRRGPKPDSKPALTRRQELNRQAQRTHRERKEQYIKALEEEVLRLKEVFAESTRERDRVREENVRLKALLQQHGISYDFAESPVKFQRDQSSGYGPSSRGSINGSFLGAPDSAGGLSPRSNGGQSRGNNGLQPQGPMPHAGNNVPQLPNNPLNFDQLGIDFVLAPLIRALSVAGLEKACMEHMQYLVVRSHNSDGQDFHHPMENPDDRDHDNLSGHALMATCPPLPHIRDTPNEPYPYQMPELNMPDLRKLLHLSARLPINHTTEITPIMAWTKIYTDPRLALLSPIDVEKMKLNLQTKTRCYGFGAVLEEFEVRDAIETVMAKNHVQVPSWNPRAFQPHDQVVQSQHQLVRSGRV